MLRAVVICVCVASAYSQIGSFNLPTMGTESSDTPRDDLPYGVFSNTTSSMDTANQTSATMAAGHSTMHQNSTMSTATMHNMTDATKPTMIPWSANNHTTEMANSTISPAPTSGPKSSASTTLALSILTCLSAAALSMR